MRCDCKVIGVGKRRSGVSKKGNSYDFRSVSVRFAAGEAYDDGYRCTELSIDTAAINAVAPWGIKVGDTLDIVMHPYAGRMFVDALLGVESDD